MIASLIKTVLSNPSVSLFVLGVIGALISLWFKKGRLSKPVVIERLVAYYLLFSIGIGFLNNFVMHVVFAEYTANFIGWENSPFQLEVGFASLGMGVAGLMAFRQGMAFRLATLLPPAFFLWAAACGHIYQIITTHNLAAGNAGAVLWMDIFIPLIGFALLYTQRRIGLPADESSIAKEKA